MDTNPAAPVPCSPQERAYSVANELRKLAHLAGRGDLTDSQLQRLADPAAFVFSRLAALAVGEVRELELFSGPTGRAEKDYARRAGRRRGSVASQFSVWLRKVFLPGRALPNTGPKSALKGTWCTSFDARIGSRSGKAIFVWRDDVYRPRSDGVCDPKLTRLLAPVDRLLRQTHRCIGEVTSWGLISRAVPTRHAGLKGYLYPIGRGLNLQSRPITDRPSVSAELGAMLTGFFHDEPMTQAYSNNAWLIVGPGGCLWLCRMGGRRTWPTGCMARTNPPALPSWKRPICGGRRRSSSTTRTTKSSVPRCCPNPNVAEGNLIQPVAGDPKLKQSPSVSKLCRISWRGYWLGDTDPDFVPRPWPHRFSAMGAVEWGRFVRTLVTILVTVGMRDTETSPPALPDLALRAGWKVVDRTGLEPVTSTVSR